MKTAAVAPAGEWAFDPEWITLNNGSYGACPASVRAIETGWRARIDRQPTRFFHAELAPLLRDAAAAIATRVRVPADTLAFVSNATEGVNAVLRSWPKLAPGDEILLLDQAYGAVRNAARFVAEPQGACLIEAALPRARCTPADVVAAVERALSPRTALAILDHVCSPSGLVLPIAEMVAACHRRSVPVLVDGAHAPGQVPLDLGAIGADFYVGNLHKWYWAPPGTGFIHVPAHRQAGLHALAVSHGLDAGFIAEFDWTGTRDAAAWLAAPDALALHDRCGGEGLMERNARLVREGAQLVADGLGTSVAPACLPGAMALVALPGAWGGTAADAVTLRRRLIAGKIDVPVVASGGGLHLRLSAHAWNQLGDFERLLFALGRL